LMAVTLNYASVLVKTDKILHPNGESANLDQLDKAQNYLNTCTFINNNEELNKIKKTILKELLARKIDCLVALLKVPVSCDHWSIRAEFTKAHQVMIDTLKKELTTYISLNAEDKTDAMRANLAKMHYILADTMEYFESNRDEAIPIFKKATELMPENPYYRAYFAELTENRNMNENARKEIQDMRHLNLEYYDFYMEERWHKDKINSFDIHAVPTRDYGVFSGIIRAIGFS
jgi:tetratricopeptide (TPR) repeat protein